MIKRHFQKRKFAHSLHQMNSSSLLRTMIKETWKTPRLATILDFNELEVVYHLQKKSGNFGWNVNGKTKLVFPNGKFPGKTGFLER